LMQPCSEPAFLAILNIIPSILASNISHLQEQTTKSFEQSCILYMLRGGNITFHPLGSLVVVKKQTKSRSEAVIPQKSKRAPTYGVTTSERLPAITNLRYISISSLSVDDLTGSTRPTAFLPTFSNFPFWDCILYYPPTTTDTPRLHKVVFIQTSIQSIRTHEQQKKITIWNDATQNEQTVEVGRIHKSLLPNVQTKDGVSTRRPPMVEQITTAISGVPCEATYDTISGTMKVTASNNNKSSTDRLDVRFVFMTAQTLDTITKEELGKLPDVVGGELPKLANLDVVICQEVEGFSYLQHLARRLA